MERHTGNAKDFVDLIGLEAATALFDALGGTNFPFPLGINNNPEGAARFKQLEGIVGASAALELIKGRLGKPQSPKIGTRKINDLRGRFPKKRGFFEVPQSLRR